MSNRIKIAIAEDHELLRQGLVSLMEEEEGIDVVINAANGAQLITEMERNPVDVVLMDLDMPIVNGHQALDMIQRIAPESKVIIISMYYSNDFIAQCLSMGARGFLPKNCKIETVVDAIYEVHQQGFYFNDKVSKEFLYKLIDKKEYHPIINGDTLTEVEIGIVRQICEGKTNEEISDFFKVPVTTVDDQRKMIMKPDQSGDSSDD